MDKNTLVVVILGVLVLVALVQAFQMTSLKGVVSGGSVVSSPASAPASSGQQAKLPSNLDNLPSMVGGC